MQYILDRPVQTTTEASLRPNQEKARRLQTNALAIHLNKRFLRVWLWRLKIKGVTPPKKSQDENTPTPHLMRILVPEKNLIMHNSCCDQLNQR